MGNCKGETAWHKMARNPTCGLVDGASEDENVGGDLAQLCEVAP